MDRNSYPFWLNELCRKRYQDARGKRQRTETAQRERGRSQERKNTLRVGRPERNQLVLPVQPLIREIDTIIGGPTQVEAQIIHKKKYIPGAKEPANVNYHLHTFLVGTGKIDPITFTSTDATGVHFPHDDTLVVRIVVAKNGLEKMLVDDGSSVNIIYGTTYDKMDIETPLISATDPIYGYTGESIIPRGTIILMTKIGESPTAIRTPMEYLVVDKSSSYQCVLGRPAFINLGTVTHTKFLCMEFSTDRRIATVRENQFESRSCYTNAMKKFMDREVNVVDVEMNETPSEP
ncbi:Uncharacterized protein Adt_30776 [Abeliophyllum distichum]|uniref:Uncharacterized protein n=1 Tax=Abeliophyllum distichum TaxID=126358 RepID=A0ABD1RC92_9LAMI